MFQILLYWYLHVCTNNIDDDIPWPGHNYTTAQKTIVCHTMILWCVHYIIIPLGNTHRHVVDVLTIYPYHSVSSIDTLYLV